MNTRVKQIKDIKQHELLLQLVATPIIIPPHQRGIRREVVNFIGYLNVLGYRPKICIFLILI